MLNAWTYRIYRCTKSLATFLTVWNALPIILRGRSPPWSFSRGLPSFDPRLAGMTRANPYGKPAAFPKIWQVGKPMITIFLTTPDRSFAIRSPCRIISLFFAFFLAHVIQRIAPQEQLNLMAENAVVIAAAWQRRWIEFRDPDQYESGYPQVNVYVTMERSTVLLMGKSTIFNGIITVCNG